MLIHISVSVPHGRAWVQLLCFTLSHVFLWVSCISSSACCLPDSCWRIWKQFCNSTGEECLHLLLLLWLPECFLHYVWYFLSILLLYLVFLFYYLECFLWLLLLKSSVYVLFIFSYSFVWPFTAPVLSLSLPTVKPDCICCKYMLRHKNKHCKQFASHYHWIVSFLHTPWYLFIFFCLSRTFFCFLSIFSNAEKIHTYIPVTLCLYFLVPPFFLILPVNHFLTTFKLQLVLPSHSLFYSSAVLCYESANINTPSTHRCFIAIKCYQDTPLSLNTGLLNGEFLGVIPGHFEALT